MKADSTRRALVVALIALVAMIPLEGWRAPAGLAAPTVVRITHRLEPKQLTVPAGTVVSWRNKDGERHRIRSTSGPDEFDSGNLEPGESFRHTFRDAGTYRYRDERNKDAAAYHGTIVVEAPPAQTPPPPPPQPDPPPDPGPGPEPPPPPPPPSGNETISIVDRRYAPASVTVAVGTTVSWRNNDDRIHTVTARNGSFDSGIMAEGATYRRTFSVAGTFDYFCTVHPDMTARVVVTGSAPGPSPPPPPTDEPPPPETPPPAPGPAPAADVRILDFRYGPANLAVPAGTTVSWANAGAAPHTVTGADFDSGLLLAGDTYRRTFIRAGTYDYFCTVHPEMRATVVVTAADGASPTPPAPGPAPAPPSAPEPPRPAPAGDVRVVDFGYRPGTITVSAGSSVAFANAGAAPHTVTATDGSFDSGFLAAGDTYRRRFASVGSFDYFCTIHPAMRGTVVVTGSSSSQADSGEGELATPGGPGAEPTDRGFGLLTSGIAGGTLRSAPTEGLSAAPVPVGILDFEFAPPSIEIETGTEVVWTNSGVAPHTVTDVAARFDSGILEAGSSFTHRFDALGTYEYLCALHPDMVGSIRVVSAAVSAGAGESSDEPPVGAGESPPPALAVAPIGASPTTDAPPPLLTAAVICAALLLVANLAFLSVRRT